MRRGFWKLTSEGMEFANSHPDGLTTNLVMALASQNLSVPLSSESMKESTQADSVVIDTVSSQSPDDRLEEALQEIRRSIAAELLEILSGVSPQYFESIVLDLLHRMGYGTSRDDIQRVGGTGDGGIDGVISLDRLGLEKVYIQAKRWQGNVGRPDVQAFYGALAGQRANKGVFITTSTYTQQARDFAGSVEKIILIDGVRLADLMIDYEVGITSRQIRVPKVDTDYFEA